MKPLRTKLILSLVGLGLLGFAGLASCSKTSTVQREAKLDQCRKQCDRTKEPGLVRSLCQRRCERSHGDKRSLAQLKKACGKGEARACRRYGFKHFRKDKRLLVTYLKKGCDAGDGLSCHGLARATDDGLGGLKKSRAASSRHYKRGCELGNGKSCVALGHRFIEKKSDRALKLYQKACKADDHIGCGMVGVVYRDGKGVSRDPKAAKRYFAKSCAMGWKVACKADAKLRRRAPVNKHQLARVPAGRSK